MVARSSFSSNKQGGSFTISLPSKLKQQAQTDAIDLVFKKPMPKLFGKNKGIDAGTLDSAKSYVKGQFPPRLRDIISIAFFASWKCFVYDF